MAISKDQLMNLLTPYFKGAIIELQDLVGDSDHYKISIFWDGFKGMTRIAQHRKVYQALGDIAGTSLHALSIETKEQKGV